MAHGDIETFQRDGKWLNRADDVGLLSRHDDRQTAIIFGREMARRRRVEHRIRNLDGTIGEVKNYRDLGTSPDTG